MTSVAPMAPIALRGGLAVYSAGSGEPLLLMPYPHAEAVVGDALVDTLVEGLLRFGRRVITFDPPGAGGSARPMRLDMPEMLECAEEALRACGVEGAVDVFGHSMGGLAALAFAIERPARVRRLVLAGAAAGGPSYLNAHSALWNRSHPAYWRLALPGALYWLTRRRAAEQWMFDVIARASYADPGTAPRRHMTWRDWLRPAHPRTRWGFVARRLDYRAWLASVRVPTLVLVGAHDPQTPPACAQELARGIPTARLVVLAHSGHRPFEEEPAAFWRAVRRFLRSTQPRALVPRPSHALTSRRWHRTRSETS